MELAHYNEQNYQFELHAYQIAFLDFKYKPPSFVSIDIKTSSRVPTTPFMVQPVAITKLVSPLRGGTCLEIIPLPVWTFSILVQVATIINEPVRGSEKYVKKHAELVNPSFTIY
jgi:hypothetical protein